MAKPSLFSQVEAVALQTGRFMPSPRHWNPGLFRFKGKLWLAYRYHLQTSDSRCAIAICPLDPVTLQPSAASQPLGLAADDMTFDHYEDPRLFIFRDEPYISYTEMRGYEPGVDYTCCMKYARLRLTGSRWSVIRRYQPLFGSNDGTQKEKNWVFFEHDRRLFCIYGDTVMHSVVELEGERIIDTIETPQAIWHWGSIRGGTPPIPWGDKLLTFFHSSLPTEEAPHFVRYFAGAYLMEARPPFAITAISQRPIMAGSERDGHKVDPRYVEGWKPYVVFPCGAVEQDGRLLVSLGVNDWACVVARIDESQLALGSPDGSDFKPRYFTVTNGSIPVRLADEAGRMQLVDWSVPRPGPAGMTGPGFMKVDTPRHVEELIESKTPREITKAEYEQAVHRPVSRYVY